MSLYIQNLYINPFYVALTFRSSPRKNWSLLGAFQMYLTNIDNAQLYLNGLERSDLFGSSKKIKSQILQHYQQQLIRESYKVLGSIEFFGSPIGVFRRIYDGFNDLLWEPIYGLVSSPFAFFIGAFKGISSFTLSVIFAISDVLVKMTGSFERALGSVKFHAGAIRNPLDGLLTALGGFKNRPKLHYSKKNKVLGLIRGAVEATSDLAILPVVGICSFVLNYAVLVRSIVDPNTRLIRTRHPRLLYQGRIAKPYKQFANISLLRFWDKYSTSGAAEDD
jgi:vacuolar protein sorting-associated protein 13A/C